MDQDRTIFIIETLANGADPITGKVLPECSPYNHPDVIRALFQAIRLIPKQRKQKKTLEEKQQINLEKGLPKNYGLPWDEDSKNLVVSKFQSNKPIDEIASEFERKASSIISLLKKLEVISEEQAFVLGQQFK